MRNIFIEGIQGTGKTVLLDRLQKACPEYCAYREGDLSFAGLAWCSLMDRDDYTKMKEKFSEYKEEIEAHTMVEEEKRVIAYTQVLTDLPEFYKYMENFEVYHGKVDYDVFRNVMLGRYQRIPNGKHIFESSLFQNILESMLLFYELPEKEILDYYEQAYKILREKKMLLLYLECQDIRDMVLRIRAERRDIQGKELWFPLMINYLNQSPYGRRRKTEGMDDLILYLQKRKRLEEKIIREILSPCTIQLAAKRYSMEKVVSKIRMLDGE